MISLLKTRPPEPRETLIGVFGVTYNFSEVQFYNQVGTYVVDGTEYSISFQKTFEVRFEFQKRIMMYQRDREILVTNNCGFSKKDCEDIISHFEELLI